ncbi:ABC transporter permease [Methanobacterium petrolearium]|uniref:ABC transporter permease n=1 Tax=Methanobacterium petrolearium TaxID=710190 RepID=UPI001AE599FC|nr:ABC transporter permease [Methanobacterium petrolearium]MBP1946086.1 putative ABC transport system permease protein [Methanobacterium petrolearium]BDZ70776.1 ABC transporter permease [Methanobacterium petrolearium]
MSFLSFIVKNPFRNRTRSILAIVGIAIGIATIVALGIVTDGLKESTESTLKAGQADFTITKANSGGFFSSTLNQSYVGEVQNITGVKEAVGVLVNTYSLNGDAFILMGISPDKLELANINLQEGNAFTSNGSNELILGKRASQSLNKHVGDTVTLFGSDFKITGIYETGNMWEDGGAFLNLEKLQNLTDNQGKVTMIFVKIDNDAQLQDVTDSIEDTYPNKLTTIKSVDDFNRVNKGLSSIDTASWAISLLAILIGGIGVINTMVMSVYERTREIGVLKAVGWKNKRILTMIMGESLVLTIFAALIGIIMGVVAVNLILLSPSVGGFIKPVYSPLTFIKGFGVAILVGLIGGLYPAYRASRLSPTEALRYE